MWADKSSQVLVVRDIAPHGQSLIGRHCAALKLLSLCPHRLTDDSEYVYFDTSLSAQAMNSAGVSADRMLADTKKRITYMERARFRDSRGIYVILKYGLEREKTATRLLQ